METTNKKGRLSAQERDYKQSHAKQLFINGFAMGNISEIVGIGVKTLASWREVNNWEREKELNNIRPSEITKMILEYIQDLKDGKKSSYTPDQLSKVASAFERLNDTRKIAVYTMESFDGFCQFLMKQAGETTGKKREHFMDSLKNIRPLMDKYINLLASND